jgi:hypothetical protein
LGKHVFLCDDSGQPTPYVPSIGVPPDYSVDPRQLLQKAMQGGLDAALKYAEWAGVRLEPNDVDWFGEVVTLEMEGRVGLRLCNGKTVTVDLKNILLLNSSEVVSATAPGTTFDACMQGLLLPVSQRSVFGRFAGHRSQFFQDTCYSDQNNTQI